MAKKSFKAFTATAIAAGALTPAAVFAAETPAENNIDSVLVVIDGEAYSISFAEYNEALSAGIKFDGKVGYVVSDGKTYSIADYNEALGGKDTPNEALKELAKDPANAQNVTAGTIVISKDGVDYKPAPTTVNVESVKAINTTILEKADVDTDKYKLALDYLDADGKAIAADKLPADLKVSFADNKDVFAADGTIKNKANIPASGDITVVAKVTSESQNIDLTKEFKVTVVSASDWAEVTGADILFNSDVKGSVVTLSDSATLAPTVAKTNGGTELKGDTAPSNWSGNVKSVKSSDIKVLTVNKSGNNINLVPVSAGTATVTVTLNSGYEYTKEISVKAEDRKPAKIVPAENKVTLSSTVKTNSVKATVTDQYGDAVKGATVYTHPEITGDKAIVDSTSSSSTDKEGVTTVSVKAAATAKTGTDKVKLSTESDAKKAGLADITVEYAEAGDVSSYDLRIASDSESKDATIDTYKSDDDALKLEFIGKDSKGVVAKVYDQTAVGSTYTVTSSDEAVATASVDSSTGKINVAPVKAGKTTITVKEGNITRATFEVTVVNSTPAVGTIETVKDAKFAIQENDTVTLNQAAVKSLIKVGDYDLNYRGDVIEVLDGTKKIGTVEILSSNASLATVSNNKTVATATTVAEDADVSLLFRLKDNSGAVKDVATLPITIDNTKPEVTSAKGIQAGTVKATKTVDTNLKLVAKDAGVEGNNIKIEVAKATPATSASDTTATSVAVTENAGVKTIKVTAGSGWNADALPSGEAVPATLKNVVDAINGDAVASALVVASLNATDGSATAGNVSATSLTGGTSTVTLNITFTEAVDTATAETTTNYTFSGGATTATSADLADDNKTVKAVFTITDSDNKLVPGTSTVSVQNVEDLVGNVITTATKTITAAQ